MKAQQSTAFWFLFFVTASDVMSFFALSQCPDILASGQDSGDTDAALIWPQQNKNTTPLNQTDIAAVNILWAFCLKRLSNIKQLTREL